MLSQGKTEGVFQFESAGMTATVMKLRPERLEDLIAVISFTAGTYGLDPNIYPKPP